MAKARLAVVAAAAAVVMAAALAAGVAGIMPVCHHMRRFPGR